MARGLTDPDSAEVEWLRRHSSYLAAGGADAALVSPRSLLAVYLVLGALFLAVFGSLDAVGYFDADAAGASGFSGASGQGRTQTPIPEKSTGRV